MIQEIEDKFKEYVKDNLTISEDTYPSWYNKDRRVKRAYVSCPCGNDRLQNVDINIDNNGNFDKTRPIPELAWKLSTHVERKVRLYADKKHIDILIDIIGKEEALKLIYEWAKKNVAVAKVLLKYIEILNNDLFCVNSETGGKDE